MRETRMEKLIDWFLAIALALALGLVVVRCAGGQVGV